MSTYILLLDLKEADIKEDNYKMNKRCLCCSSQSDYLINIGTCKHTGFLDYCIKFKVGLSNEYVCVVCHNMLQKIEIFKQQVEENVVLLSEQAHLYKVNKLHNLQRSIPHITDSTEPDPKDFEIKHEDLDVEVIEHDIQTDVEVIEHDIQTDVKVEHDSSDFEADIPAATIKKTKRGKNIERYEGKIRVFKLTLKELNKEREDMAKQKKYLNLPYKCEYCISGFDHEPTWKNHMEKRHKKIAGSFQCNICMSVLNSKTSFNEHRKRHFIRFECLLCTKIYNHEPSAFQHYDERHLPAGSSLQREYTCKVCGFTTTVNRTYRYHKDKHKKKEECKLCGNTFVNANTLKMHMYTVHKQSSRVYRCDPCDKTYNTRSGLISHLRGAHGETPPAYCSLCRTHYMSQQALQTHLNTNSKHISDNDKRYICDDCGAKFVKKSSLQIHINWEHLKLQSHRCGKCAKLFKTAPSLRRHVDYVHNKLRPPRNKICHFCGRGFTTQNILVSHLRTHTGERPLKCDHCCATFAHKGALYTHVKLKHSGLNK